MKQERHVECREREEGYISIIVYQLTGNLLIIRSITCIRKTYFKGESWRNINENRSLLF